MSELQLELETVIDHGARGHTGACSSQSPIDRQCICLLGAHEDTHKPAGIRLAKMLSHYDDSPSSQLWSDIQRLAREILK
ncbi:hypothetical protein D3C71_2007260 [compost metagenome]